MFCESCGKKLIRGYQFCIECGAPVPAGASEEEENAAAEAAQPAQETDAPVSMPDVQPINNEGGSLVFCQTCGMHMQSSNKFCEKCGKPLGGSGMNSAAQFDGAGSVPLVNDNSLDNDFTGMSDSDIEEINNFMNGGGISAVDGNIVPTGSGDMGYVGGPAVNDIDQLAQQLASFGVSASEMPAVGEPVAQEMRQVAPKNGETLEVQDFAMDAPVGYNSNTDFSDGAVPVISGGSMDERPDEDVSLDPYAFVNNVIEGTPETPAPVEPVIEQPVVDIAPVEPVIEEPVVDIAPVEPVIEEPVVDIAPVEPVIVEPVVDIAPVEPVIEQPVVDIAPVEPVIEEPVVDIAPVEPVIEEPVVDIAPVEPVIEEPAVDIAPVEPVIEEPVVGVALAEPVTEAPVFEESPAIPEFEQSIPEQPYIAEGEPVIQEGVPYIAESQPFEQPVMSAPAPAPEPAPIPVRRPARGGDPDALPAEDPVLGKLSYCRNCGQDMYEKQPACKNCGAPYKAPPKHDKSLDNKKKNSAAMPKKKSPFMKALPTIIGVGALAAVILFLVISSNTNDKPVEPDIGPAHTTSNQDTSKTEPADTTPAPEDTTKPTDESTPAPEDTSKPEESDTEPAESDPVESTPEDSEPENSDVSSSEPDDEPAVSDTTSEDTPAESTTPNTTTTTKPQSKPEITSSATKSLEKDRQAIMDAASLMAGEVGKIDMLAQNIIYAMENGTGSEETNRSTFLKRDFAKNILASIDSGKTAVDAAVSKAKPKNSSLNSQYDALVALQKKYNVYYSFIKAPTGNASKFTSSCASYLTGFTSAAENLKYTKFTSSYTANETSASYAAMLSDAVTAANNAVSSFTTLQSKLTAVDKNKFDTAAVAELSKAANSKTLANAAAYAYEVAAYRTMLANAPSAYSSAYNNLKTISDSLNSLVDLYNMIQENDMSSYKTESSSNIATANSAISSLTKAIS